MEMDGTLDFATLTNMEPSDAPILARAEPFWRKCDSYESILYDLLSVETQVNAQNGDHLKPNQYFWHYIQDVDTDGNIRHFAVNNPEQPVLKEAGELPVDDAGSLKIRFFVPYSDPPSLTPA